MNSIDILLFNEASKSVVNHQISCIILDKRNRLVSIGHNRNLLHSNSLHQCLLRG